MASSAETPHHHHLLPLPTPYAYAATSAPPPTPSANPDLSSRTPTPDALSHLLHRLPPTLSLSLPTRRPSRLSSAATSTTINPITPPVISLSDPTPSILSAFTEHGFFHLSDHPIPSHLPISGESAAVSLFNLPHHQKQHLLPNNWPLGYDSLDGEDDDAGVAGSESLCLDTSCSGELPDVSVVDLGPLLEFGREIEKLGLEVIRELASAVGFENPTRDKLSCLLWVSDGANKPSRVYPYAVGLHYVIRSQKYSMCTDSGPVCVLGRADSVLVTIGDIAQVWSNGRLKKVRGMPVPSLGPDDPDSRSITMSLLVTLPIESTVSPLLPNLAITRVDEQDNEESYDGSIEGEQRLFHSFSFEDYAWRVYHERLLLKDPLVRYRV